MPRATSDKEGLIYLLRLHPPGRFKIGFTGDRKTLERRLKEARTWIPEAALVKTWPALEKHERMARFVMGSDLTIEQALAEFHFGDWSRNAGGEIAENGEESALIRRGDYLFAKVLTLEV